MVWTYKAKYPVDILCQRLLGGVNDELFSVLQREHNIPKDDLHALAAGLRRAEEVYVERALTQAQRAAQLGRTRFNNPQANTYFHNTRQEVIRQPHQFQPRSSQPPPRPPQQSKPTYQPVQQRQAPLQPPPRPSAPAPQYVPMDVDRLKQKNANVKCYKCRQMGHYARDCSLKQINELSQEAQQEILRMHLSNEVVDVQEEDEAQVFDLEDIYPVPSSSGQVASSSLVETPENFEQDFS